MSEQIKHIVFQLNDEEYGVNIEQVRSIEKLTQITRIPQTSQFIKGVINLRGEITPLIDLKDRLHIGEMNDDEQTRVLIVTLNDIQVGLIVDSASDVIDIEESTISQPPKAIGGVTANYLTGVANLGNRLLILLDTEKVLHFEEIDEIREVAENDRVKEED